MRKQQYRVGGSARRDGVKNATSSKKGSLTKSPQPINEPAGPPSRGFQRESLGDLDARLDNVQEQKEELKHHLEKLGILGDKYSEQGTHVGGGSASKSLLHNWQPNNSINEDQRDEEEVDGPFIAEKFEQQASPDMRKWLDTAREDPNAYHEYGAFELDEGFERERRGKASEKAIRIPAMVDRVLRNNAQSLSPLVLGLHDDLHKFSQSKSSLFTLEEPYKDEEECYVDETESDYSPAHIAPASSMGAIRSYPPLGPRQSRRASRKLSSTTNFRHVHMFGDFNSEVGRGNSRMRPDWEQEFLKYEVDSMELPKDKPNQRSRSHRPHKNHGAGQEAPLYSRKVGGRKGGALAVNQQYMNYASHAKRNPHEVHEPLPLLTELEDYNESEELGASSVDADYEGRLSNRELEALNSCEARHGQGLVREEDKRNLQLAFMECKELALCEYKPRNLSQKYRPRAFEEVVGQGIVTQALSNAISMGKIAPVYLLQGSRGTGKTSAARIFAAALVCRSADHGRPPCGACHECIGVAMGKCSEVKEVDAASNNGIERVKVLLEETISTPPLSRYKVFIIDECHMLTTETWNALLKMLEEPPMNVVFILITTDPDRLPRTALSRCQKFPFPKIKESEIVKRLEQLAGLENLEVDADTLQLIASRSDGSLRDAETTLDQLSLLGQEISPSSVYELVGSASDERMLGLLDCALQADTVGTVRTARELVESGVEPLSLMSRLATLITDLLAGSFKFTESQRKGFFRKQTLSEQKLELLRMAMKTLSEAEKQIRVSNDRTTWLTAALLQLGPDRSSMFPSSCAGTSVTQSPGALDDMGDTEAVDYEGMSSGRQMWDDDAHHSSHETWGLKKSGEVSTTRAHRKFPPGRYIPTRASPHQMSSQLPQKQPYDGDLSDEDLEDLNSGQMLSSSKLDEIWYRVVERCQPAALRQLLHVHGKLISISMSEVDALVHLEVSNPEYKSTCERAQRGLTSVFKSVLGFPVDVKISLASLSMENEEVRDGAPGGTQQGSVNGPTRAYSLSHWKHGGSAMEAPQSNALECFPAIPQTSFVSPPKEAPYLAQWNSSNMGVSPGHPNIVTNMEDQMQHTRAHEPRHTQVPLPSSVSLSMNLEESRQRRFQDMADKGDGYNRRGLEYDGMGSAYSDGERHLGELDMQSPEPHEEAALGHTTRHGRNMEGPRDSDTYYVDGRPNCDRPTDLQNRKGSSLKMVRRRLTMRSRTRSLPSSNPNSPDDRGSSRFITMKNHVHPSQKNIRDSHHLSGEEEAADFTPEAGNYGASSQKKGLLKGAAGSFARFFKGSK